MYTYIYTHTHTHTFSYCSVHSLNNIRKLSNIRSLILLLVSTLEVLLEVLVVQGVCLLFSLSADLFVIILVFVFPDLLAEPNISLSSSAFGFSNVEQKRFYLLLGSNFTVTCSAKPQYQGGFFQLLLNDSGTVRNYTTPAVNHSANFLFYAADHTHQGDYRCFYHNNVFSHNFSSHSQTFSLILQGSFLLLFI